MRQAKAWALGILVCSASVASSTQLDRGVLIDKAVGIAYAADPAGYIHAIDLSAGRSEWVNQERALPLGVHDGKLIALGTVEQFGLGMILIMDAANGAIVDRIAFDLPEHVSAELTAKPQRRFDVRIADNQAGLRLYWEFQSRPLRGAQLASENPEGVDHYDHRVASGALDLHFNGSDHYMVAVRGSYPVPEPWRPDLAANEQLPSVVGRQFRSIDDQHVLASTTLEHETFGSLHHWSVHERSSGELLGELESHYSLSSFAVAGDVFIYRAGAISYSDAGTGLVEKPERLVGYDLQRARELWSVPILDLEYRGPLPP